MSGFAVGRIRLDRRAGVWMFSATARAFLRPYLQVQVPIARLATRRSLSASSRAFRAARRWTSAGLGGAGAVPQVAARMSRSAFSTTRADTASYRATEIAP